MAGVMVTFNLHFLYSYIMDHNYCVPRTSIYFNHFTIFSRYLYIWTILPNYDFEFIFIEAKNTFSSQVRREIGDKYHHNIHFNLFIPLGKLFFYISTLSVNKF